MAFPYTTGERFADIEILRYRLDGFEQLSLQQKKFIYCLAKATLYGRDITFDQFGRLNLKIRRTLEAVASLPQQADDTHERAALMDYLRRVWFSNGIYHHYGSEKFRPDFSPEYLRRMMHRVPTAQLPLDEGQTVDQLTDQLAPTLFDPNVAPKKVNKADGEDLVKTSAVNFYQDTTQQEAEAYYNRKKAEAEGDPEPESFGLNSTLVGNMEHVWSSNGLYANSICYIIQWLEEARKVAENDQQREVIRLLIKYYETGSLRVFNDYCKAWVRCLEGQVDFVNGFIEVYNDPLGLKGSWEGIVEYVDQEATHRTEVISQNAQWFEDHSPIDPRFRKPVVKGVSARVVRAAMLGGDEYPSTAIGINLPNADWIRSEYGSKSVTISNLTEAYDRAARGNGFREEFVADPTTRQWIDLYGDQTDNLHTDLHECLGHGSGQLLPGTDPDALKAYGNTIEEARADLFALYYMADPKLLELGLLHHPDAYKACYYTYLMNGAMTQLTRIKPGHQIEEAHMRNRALISRWLLAHANGAAQLVKEDKTFLRISDYTALRPLVGQLLAEVQRIKSEGDFNAARQLVEQYAIHVDPDLHQEVLKRYEALNLAPYKGFLNPRLLLQRDRQGNIVDVIADYSETYDEQMLRYGREYATLV
jgi:dipeptidyl-peptidase-3